MQEERLAHFKRRLEEERARLAARRDALRQTGLERSLGESLGELSTYDNHPADIGDELFERAKDLGLRDRLSRGVAEIDAALERIVRGEYGRCERCGRPIGEERLEVLPATALCRDCAARQEEERGRGDPGLRPVEEELLSPPFGRTWNDGRDVTGYDGEDAWQDVALYGTSETPQDVPDAGGYDRLYPDGKERRGAVADVETIAEREGETPAEPDEADREDR